MARKYFAMLSLTIWVLLIGSCKTVSRQSDTVYRLRVTAGDSLSALALKYDTQPEKIAKLNQIDIKDQLFIGQIILVKPGPAGRIAKGDGAINQPASKELPSSKRRGLLFDRPMDSSTNVIWPVDGRVTSEFGMRGGRPHEGIDIAARRGSPIRSVATGSVTFTGWRKGYGRTVIVEHNGFDTFYAHCERIKVAVGDRVQQGDKIAEVGTSGNASAPHLHFEYHTTKGKINPRQILPDHIAMR